MPWTIAIVVLLLGVLAFPAGAQGALWYDFNEPYATATGPEVRMYDWSTQRCEGNHNDIPDQPARAFRDENGNVSLIASHMIVWRSFGPTLETAAHQCSRLYTSGFNSDPSKYDYYSWVSSPYTRDGRTVYSLSHVEYQGWKFEPGGYCNSRGEDWPSAQKCWYNAITLLTSTDGGATFSHSPSPTHYVASPPYRYSKGIGPIGFFAPSNIVRGRDGYYYTIVHVEPSAVQPSGACLWRTQDLSDPTSWRAWGGAGFTVRFLDPYANNITDPAQYACEPVGSGTIETGSDTLTWNTYLKKWLLVRAGGGGDYAPGFYMYTSDDLINWDIWERMVSAELPWTHTCGEPDYMLYPSLLDPESKSRNFETTGQRPYLFFTHFNVAYEGSNCWMDFDRDLMRVPIELSNQVPGGPTATLSASTTSARTGENVRFDASGSRDADGSIVKYEWDLDGDGTYERETGTTAVTGKAYDMPDSVTVTVRVSDDDGKATDETRIVRVSGPALDSGTAGGSAGPSDGTAPSKSAGATPASATAAAVARFRLVGKPLARRDGSVVIRINAPAAGRLRVRAVGQKGLIRPASAVAGEAGDLVLRVRPSRRGRVLLDRRGRVRVRAAVTFTPVGGAPQSERHTLTLRAKR